MIVKKCVYAIMMVDPKGIGEPWTKPKPQNGSFLDENGNFTKLSNKTWFFNYKKEAVDYASDSYNWGTLFCHVRFVKFNRTIEYKTELKNGV